MTWVLLQEGYRRAGLHTVWSNVVHLFDRARQLGRKCCVNPRMYVAPSPPPRWPTEQQSALYSMAVDPVGGGIALRLMTFWHVGQMEKLYSNLNRGVYLPRYSIASACAKSGRDTVLARQQRTPITAGDNIV